MPIFAQLVAGLFTGLSTFLFKLFVAKVTIRVLAVAAIGALSTGLLLAFNNFIAPLVAQAFNTQYGQFLGLAFPPVAGTVLMGMLTLYAACMAYRLHVSAIKMTANL